MKDGDGGGSFDGEKGDCAVREEKTRDEEGKKNESGSNMVFAFDPSCTTRACCMV